MSRWRTSRHAARLTALLRFALGGVASAATALGTSALLHESAAVPARAAVAIALVVAFGVNFAVLRYFVFRGTTEPLLRQLLAFAASSGVFRGLEYVGFLLLNAWLAVHYLAALLSVLAVSFVLKFLFYDAWVFARRSEPRGAELADGAAQSSRK